MRSPRYIRVDPGPLPRREEAGGDGGGPDEFVDEIALVGPAGRIRERVAAWKAAGVTDMIVGAGQPEALELLASAV